MHSWRDLEAEPLGWVSAAPNIRDRSPPIGCCHTLVGLNDTYLILFGGASSFEISNAVHVFDLNTQKWRRQNTTHGDMVAPRIGHSAVVLNQKMIVYGGQDSLSPLIYRDVLELDLAEWKWSFVHHALPDPEGPGTRRMHSAQLVGCRMYVFFGSPSGVEYPFWYLDLTNYKWHVVLPIGGPLEELQKSLCGCSSAVDGAVVYLFGGHLSAGGALSIGTDHNYQSILYRYDTVTNLMTVVNYGFVPPAPLPRYTSTMAIFRGKLYLFGGDANNYFGLRYFNDLWVISLSNDGVNSADREPEWQCIVPASHTPSPRSGCSYAMVRSSLYIMGGESVAAGSYRTSYLSELLCLPLGRSYNMTLRDAMTHWLASRQLRPPARHLPASMVLQNHRWRYRSLPPHLQRLVGRYQYI